MATDKILIEVHISTEQSVKNAADLKRSIIDTQREIKKLTEATEGNAGAQKAAAGTMASLEAQLKKQRAEYSANIKEIININKVSGEYTGSINQMRASLAVLTTEYNDLSQEQRENSQIGKDLTKQIKDISNKLKEQEGAIGDTRRNVGNYAESFKDAIKDTQIFGVSVGKTAEGLKGANNAFQAAGGGVRGFGAAMLTTGIPIVVSGVQALIKYFSQFKPVVDAVEQSISFLTAGFKALVSGGSFFEAGEQAAALTKQIQDLEDAENGLAIAQAKGETELKKMLIAAKNRTLSAAEQLKILDQASAKEQEIFEERSRQDRALIDRREARFAREKNISRAELDALIERGSEEQKILADQVEARMAIDQQEIDDFAQGRIKLAQIEGASAELKEKIENRKDAAVEKGIAEREKLEKDAADRAKEREEKRLAEIEKQASLEFQIRKMLADTISNETLKAIEQETILRDERLAAIKGDGEKEVELRKLIAQDYVRKVAQIEEKARLEEEKKRDAAFKEENEKRLAAAATAFNEEIALLNQRQEVLDLMAENEITDEKALAEEKRRIATTTLQLQLEALRSFAEASGVVTEAQFLAMQKLEEQLKKMQNAVATPEQPTLADMLGINKEELAEAEKGLQAILEGIGTIQNIINSGYEVKLNQIEGEKNAEIEKIKKSTLGEKEKAEKIQAIEKKAARDTYEIEKKQFEVNQATAIIQAIINTATAIMAQFSNPTPYAGPILAALAAATGAAQIAVIASQQPPPAPFKEGGFTEKGNPNEPSNNINLPGIQLHKSEHVMPLGNGSAYVTPAHVLADPVGAYHVGELEKMRTARKSGRKYLGGMADGGFAVRGATSQVKDRQIMESVKNAIQNMPAPIVRVTDINRVNDQVNTARVSSELR